MADFIEEDLKCKPLTKKEKAWMLRLEKCLLAAPDRFELCTIGDNSLTIVDKKAMDNASIPLEDQSAKKAGMELGNVSSAVYIAGLCG